MHTTQELWQADLRDPVLAPFMQGVFPRDKLPIIKTYPAEGFFWGVHCNINHVFTFPFSRAVYELNIRSTLRTKGNIFNIAKHPIWRS